MPPKEPKKRSDTTPPQAVPSAVTMASPWWLGALPEEGVRMRLEPGREIPGLTDEHIQPTKLLLTWPNSHQNVPSLYLLIYLSTIHPSIHPALPFG